MKSTPVWESVDAEVFRTQIMPLNRPAVLRGLVRHWPAVAKAHESPQEIVEYLGQFSDEQPVLVFVGKPEIEGRFFYNEDLNGFNFESFNFEKRQLPLSAVLNLLLDHLSDQIGPAIYAGAVNVSDRLPELRVENALDILDISRQSVSTLWVGNHSRLAAHWDLANNIICVIGGRRRYTLFPTEQIRNLYFGPLEFPLGGVPISLVDFHTPDYSRFPRFREALSHAEVAELAPGDALFLPSLWLHHAESFDQLGLMMNHWWRTTPPYMFTPYQTMLHSLLSIRYLPEGERNAWRALFEHYIFQTYGEPMSHLPIESRGSFGSMTPEKAKMLMTQMQDFLQRQQVALERG
jgi:Cupin-like domain